MEKDKRSETITIRLEPGHKAALERLAAADERTLSSYVARIIKAHLQAHVAGGKTERPMSPKLVK